MKNVLILHTDQQRFDSLGCAGNVGARTPNMDRLAKEGTLFTRHISSNPICSPSRASLLTGLYPPGHNLWCNGVPLNRKEYYEHVEHRKIPADIVTEPATIPDVFGKAGYNTAALGKLHLTPAMAPKKYGYPESEFNWWDGDFDDWHGPYYGFEHVELIVGHGTAMETGHYANWLKSEHPEALRQWKEAVAIEGKSVPGKTDVVSLPIPYNLTHSAWLADRFDTYLDGQQDSDKPFCTWIGFPDPHHPFWPCDEIMEEFEDVPVKDPVDPDGEAWKDNPSLRIAQKKLGDLSMEERRTIIRYTNAMIHGVDRAIGRILDNLEERGILDDTIIVFTSDHGDYMCDHGMLYKSYGVSDALVHTPLMIRCPDSGLPDQVDSVVSNTDVLPTIAALAGIEAPEWMHGKDLRQVCAGEEDHFAFAFSTDGQGMADNYTVYDDTFRLTLYPHMPCVELYNHKEDPGECVNLAEDPGSKDVREKLTAVLREKFMEFSHPILGRVSPW